MLVGAQDRSGGSRLVPPWPPDDIEKYGYVERNLGYLATILVIGASCLIVSQLRFELHDLVLWPFILFTATYVAYQAISLPVNFTGPGFDLTKHKERIATWRPGSYPSVDILLPVCGEPLEVLRNTWAAVAELAGRYQGIAQPYVLDDGASDDARSMAESFGFQYIRRPDLPAYKKAGNLRYAFARTSGEYLLILDADFAPRADFLAETLPYLDEPTVAIVQTPQFFRESTEQTWVENAAGAVQEVFYRSIQVARNRFDAAICVGTSAVYRRAALEPFGGPDAHPLRRGRAYRARRPARRMVSGLPARGAFDWHLSGQSRLLRAPAVPVVLRERGDRILLAAVVDADVGPGPAHVHLGLLLLRLYCPAHFLRPDHPDRDARVLALADSVAKFCHPHPVDVHRVCAVPALASCEVRAVNLVAWNRTGLGPCVCDLGRGKGNEHELAPVPDARQFAAALPARGPLVERDRGPAVADAGNLADGNHGLAAIRSLAAVRRT